MTRGSDVFSDLRSCISELLLLEEHPFNVSILMMSHKKRYYNLSWNYCRNIVSIDIRLFSCCNKLPVKGQITRHALMNVKHLYNIKVPSRKQYFVTERRELKEAI